MKYVLLVVLVFGCFGFSQSVGDEPSTDEVITFFNSSEFLDSYFFHTATRMRSYHGPQHISGFVKMIFAPMKSRDQNIKRIQNEVVFGTPIKLFQPVVVDNFLKQKIDFAVLKWQLPTHPPSGPRMFGKLHGKRVAYIEDVENISDSLTYRITEDQNYYILVPIYHRQKFEGYLRVLRHNNSIVYINEFQSFITKTPIQISTQEAQQLANLPEEPILYDFSGYGLEGWPDFRKNWFWVGGSKAISASTGEVYELLNYQNQLIAFSDVEPEISIAYNGSIEASIPIKFKLVQDGIYSENFKHVRLSPKLGWDLILLITVLGCIPILINIAIAFRDRRQLVDILRLDK